jgi:hypothetical protein
VTTLLPSSSLQQNHQKRRKPSFFWNKAIEEGDESCRLFLLPYNGTIEEDDDSLLSLSSLQQKKIHCYGKTNIEGNGSIAVVAFCTATKEIKKVCCNKEGDNNFTIAFFAVTRLKQKAMLLPSPFALQQIKEKNLLQENQNKRRCCCCRLPHCNKKKRKKIYYSKTKTKAKKMT